MTGEEVLNAALQLPEEDRIRLAGRLLESVPPDDGLPLDEDEFYEELERRSRNKEGRVRAEDLWKDAPR